MRRTLYLAIAATGLCSAFVVGEEPKDAIVEIPLKEIWALNVPGTRKIEELEPGAIVGAGRFKYGPITERIVDALQLHRHTEIGGKIKPADDGFAVSGSDLAALRVAQAVLTGKTKPPESVSGEVTLVFYSLSAGVYVYLDAVEHKGNEISINYHFVTHPTANVTTHFALIPLGALPTGKYQATIKQGPTETDEPRLDLSRFDEAAVARDIVCKPFSFEVK
jgi:hypothetical protein